MSRARARLGEHWGDALVVLLCLVGVAQALWFTPWETTDDGVKVSQADPLVAARRTQIQALRARLNT